MRISDGSSDVCSSDLAVKFTPAGGTVRVSLTFNDDGVAITVADSGIGMSAEQIPIALSPFGQVDSSLSRRHEGTGLGLPLCRRFAVAHGGGLSIERVLGQGPSVTVHLPAEPLDRETVGEGQTGALRCDPGGRVMIHKQQQK